MTKQFETERVPALMCKINERDLTLIRARKTHLWCSLCTLYFLVCQVRVTVDDSGLCCYG